jgi:hypothetical protein
MTNKPAPQSKTAATNPEPMPPCPHCGNNRQVWINQITGLLTCHRAYCDYQFPEINPNQLTLDLPK